MEVSLLLLVLAVIVLWLLNAPSTKGFFGEKKVQIATGLLLDGEQYRRIDNVTLPIQNETTQIDHVIVSVYGVFVVETKNIKGWIFGREDQREWTQTLYRKSYKFQNPLRQNYLHVKALEAVLRIPSTSIQSVVVFSGDAKFKTEMPRNVTHISGLLGYIRSFDRPVFTSEECESFLARIEAARLSPTAETGRRHVTGLKKRFSAVSEGICPRCSGNLVVRVAKSGPSVGNKFLGCSGYPKCKYACALT
jgi:restriction system protein